MLRQRTQLCTSRDGARIAYATSGSGPALVRAGNWLTHLELDWHNPVWQHWLETLSRDHTLVRYDLRGSGLSDRAVDRADIDTWVDDLDAVVTAAGLERFALLGLCHGGAMAIAYAARNPQRVSRLILFDSYARGALSDGSEDARAAQEARSLGEMIELGWGKDTAAFRELFAKLLMPGATPERVTALGELQRHSASAAAAARLWTAFHSLDVYDLATRIQVPTLILHVRGDCVVPFEEGRRLAGLIPNAQFVTLESENHILQPDEPAWQQFQQAMGAFLSPEEGVVSPTSRLDGLTRREHQILQLLAQGRTNISIASQLGISDKTVRNHLTHIFDKLGVEGRGAAIVHAREAGLG